jgi:hypothetical protein
MSIKRVRSGAVVVLVSVFYLLTPAKLQTLSMKTGVIW